MAALANKFIRRPSQNVADLPSPAHLDWNSIVLPVPVALFLAILGAWLGTIQPIGGTVRRTGRMEEDKEKDKEEKEDEEELY